MKRKVKEAVEWMKRDRKKGIGEKKGWWDKECREEKRKMRWAFRSWRKGRRQKQDYKKEKKKYKEMCKRKKKRGREIEMGEKSGGGEDRETGIGVNK